VGSKLSPVFLRVVRIGQAFLARVWGEGGNSQYEKGQVSLGDV